MACVTSGVAGGADADALDGAAVDGGAVDGAAVDGGAGDGGLGGAARVAELGRNLAEVRARIDAAARAAGRDPATLTLVAVSKTWPAADVVALARLGVADFGENRDQEGRPKALAAATELQAGSGADAGAGARPGAWPSAQASRPVGAAGPAGAVRWHFIGRLQRNKARSVASWADWIHSVDRDDLVDRLDAGAAARGRTLFVCIQVSLDPKGDGPGADHGPGVASAGRVDRAGPVRGGAEPDAVERIAALVAAARHLRLAGVMAVAPFGLPARPAFARLRAVHERVLADHPEATVMSAGMSGDLEAAVAEGATHLRVGTALFGHRPRFP
jgi:hypothetical protein